MRHIAWAVVLTGDRKRAPILLSNSAYKKGTPPPRGKREGLVVFTYYVAFTRVTAGGLPLVNPTTA